MSNLFVVLMGVSVVFIGLICIILVCSLMSFLVRIFDKKKHSNDATIGMIPAQASNEIPNKQEFIAAVSAAIAEYSGKDMSGIRILSVKKL